MISINENYKNNIINMFGDIGVKWLDSIPNIIEKYVKEFELTNIKVNEPLTYNIVMSADSKKYGSVILKIEIPYKEMTIREAAALELNNGVGGCKCYYKDIDDGVLLIEKLKPGDSLNTVEDLETRTKIFSDVLNRFSIKVNTINNDLPFYKDILKRSIDMVYNEPERFGEIKEPVILAEKIYNEIETKGDNNYLLHSDLYSDNIILSGDVWKAIDPHGFLGNKVLDTAIFIQKELDKIGYTRENIDTIIKLVSKKCGYTNEEISKAFYVNYVLNICWDREVNLDTTKSLERANLINNYIIQKKKIKTLKPIYNDDKK